MIVSWASPEKELYECLFRACQGSDFQNGMTDPTAGSQITVSAQNCRVSQRIFDCFADSELFRGDFDHADVIM